MNVARFDFIATPLKDLVVVQRKAIEDDRGFLSRFYCMDEFAAIGINKPVVQINHTLTRKKGAVRGLHFQHPPHTEIKLVSCLKGEVWDVAVDLRVPALEHRLAVFEALFKHLGRIQSF